MRDMYHEIEHNRVIQNDYLIFSVTDEEVFEALWYDEFKERFGIARLQGVYKGVPEVSYIMGHSDAWYANNLYPFLKGQESVLHLSAVGFKEPHHRRGTIIYLDSVGAPDPNHPGNWGGRWQWITKKMAKDLDHTYDPRTGDHYTLIRD